MRSRPSVYLGGIISGLTFKECNEWREIAQKKLGLYGIDGYSPLRGKEHLSDDTVLHKLGYEGNVMASQRGITCRDRFDVLNCDAVIMNLLGARSPSIGCSIEVGWANLSKKPIIAIMEPIPKGEKASKNPHEHAMLLECIDYRVETVDEAVTVARKILCCEL